jgi:hypothetical protein
MNKPESTIAQQVAQAVMAFQQEMTGRAPKAVTVVLSQDTLGRLHRQDVPIRRPGA